MNIDKIAEDIARKAHSGQFRRDGLTPYVTHPQRVAAKCHTSESRAVAWLHDVLEDTPTTVEDLRTAGITEEIIQAVQCLTKSGQRPYLDYLADIRTNELARTVKIADMLDNLSDGPTERQIVKYARGLLFLHDAL